jgi:hypothetical protein
LKISQIFQCLLVGKLKSLLENDTYSYFQLLQAVEEFIKSKGNMKGWWRGETGFSNANVHGKKVAG